MTDTSIEDFANASDEDRKLMLFDSLMSLLTKAVAQDDMTMMKSYARLVTEIWNDIEE